MIGFRWSRRRPSRLPLLLLKIARVGFSKMRKNFQKIRTFSARPIRGELIIYEVELDPNSNKEGTMERLRRNAIGKMLTQLETDIRGQQIMELFHRRCKIISRERAAECMKITTELMKIWELKVVTLSITKEEQFRPKMTEILAWD